MYLLSISFLPTSFFCSRSPFHSLQPLPLPLETLKSIFVFVLYSSHYLSKKLIFKLSKICKNLFCLPKGFGLKNK
uniref:Uncharacterized protein n=1 Tax=Meloidogyne enterolobii TaxID=390850 RepID=A0A6V7WAA8_MELEN|nr:unnamed protein product [Meloidogyne enterolobii]